MQSTTTVVVASADPKFLDLFYNNQPRLKYNERAYQQMKGTI